MSSKSNTTLHVTLNAAAGVTVTVFTSYKKFAQLLLVR